MHACRLWRKQHGINLGNPPAAAAEAALPAAADGAAAAAAVPAALDGAAEPDDNMHGDPGPDPAAAADQRGGGL
ncbi:hypothetical protein OEZ85_003282 [Tetradesmus obliquus]|uniref:Uncharacterized protein n=1 Tax=Tetradesmus obliquus TaxID=3088 RepID=A0ABY8U035_TETOB|nr:hypothetical protein OEZ85_003282 [Tetradesmus obliquus]